MKLWCDRELSNWVYLWAFDLISPSLFIVRVWNQPACTHNSRDSLLCLPYSQIPCLLHRLYVHSLQHLVTITNHSCFRPNPQCWVDFRGGSCLVILLVKLDVRRTLIFLQTRWKCLRKSWPRVIKYVSFQGRSPYPFMWLKAPLSCVWLGINGWDNSNPIVTDIGPLLNCSIITCNLHFCRKVNFEGNKFI